MKRKLLIGLLLVALTATTASAQFGIVFDPTNYNNAVLRYLQLQQQLVQLQNSYAQLVAQYNFAVRMAQNIQNMPARYEAMFSQWRNVSALDTYGNTGTWVTGINSGQTPTVNTGYQQATNQLLSYLPNYLSGMNANELARVRSQYATVELSDGANTTAMSTIGSIRNNSQTVQNQIANLQQDSMSSDPNLNTEVGVLNKINAAGVLTLQTLQDSNKLLTSLLEQQTILAKQQRDAATSVINDDIARRATLASNVAQVTGTLNSTLQDFRMP